MGSNLFQVEYFLQHRHRLCLPPVDSFLDFGRDRLALSHLLNGLLHQVVHLRHRRIEQLMNLANLQKFLNGIFAQRLISRSSRREGKQTEHGENDLDLFNHRPAD